MCSRVPTIALIAALASAAGMLFAQSPPNQEAGKSHVILTELFPPAYPPLARQTRISGDVQLDLKIRQDGSVDSVEVTSGHPLLQQAAIDSAKRSRFDCTGCTESLTSSSLVYTFELFGQGNCCAVTPAPPSSNEPSQSFPRVVHSQNHITVRDQPMCFCDAGPDRKVRSMKCLYLWRCSSR
jgi:TonB family protein